jgi:hypothetical protein
MKQLIEIFKWGYEGEYYQYFFAVNSIDDFIEETNKYLNKPRTIDEDFTWWHDPLADYRDEDKVYIFPLASTHIQHINHCWHIDEDETRQSLRKASWNTYE